MAGCHDERSFACAKNPRGKSGCARGSDQRRLLLGPFEFRGLYNRSPYISAEVQLSRDPLIVSNWH